MKHPLDSSQNTELLMTVTSKGQVTIPARVRSFLKIKKSQKIALVLESEGTVRLKLPKYSNIASIVGAAGSLGRNLSFKAMRKIAYKDRFKSYKGDELSSSRR